MTTNETCQSTNHDRFLTMTHMSESTWDLKLFGQARK
jgi:hypothetical protein